ncbi:Equilibrative Nucleoside Transporter (ENT) Family [Achlya hypogyna]|uniref:Equilibrative Nucleoside Transporter (ENT) Family n=1 Tax=Achlya hypogyna TaxID=1202772 RepID=A0A1V9YYA5_ACHHY|nr:Equilibrative Nucleoside Transporter (ENT) Family [Achlya hypogyna]
MGHVVLLEKGSKASYAAVDVQEPMHLETDAIPQPILDEIHEHKRLICWSLFLLEGSAMWAYYSCLSAQDYYRESFPNVEFAFLTTPILTWPLTIGHLVQMWFGLDKSVGTRRVRVVLGYLLFAASAVAIVAQDYLLLGEAQGAAMVLMCFGIVGIAHSLVEPAYYAIAALFPDADVTNAIQLGNVSAGVFNVVASTIIRMLVGGMDLRDGQRSVQLAFYIFMGLLLLVCVAAFAIYCRLESLHCVQYLLDRADADHVKHGDPPVQALWAKFLRVAKQIPCPMLAQFMLFFCSLSLFPGIGCSSGAHVLAPSSAAMAWFCTPGIVGAFNVGDFFGRLACTQRVYAYVSLRACVVLAFVRWLWLPLLLLGMASSSTMYAFAAVPALGLWWQVGWNFVLGFTGGLFSTITMGLAPRLVRQEDREAASALMVMCLFLGLSLGSTFGWLLGNDHWFNIGL